ncbi:hypothetical protein L3Q65_00205 (plasmid) [Amycolatopsis sp. FU40]|uniref:hypothetical protein n=1 Tax=Amycolatopsis sp. FU40 TaxID=2914159 RepID=UPI001F1CDF7F|nr:hypothetical protein [Amycolatopsis sp. FU40]UKD50721.1 hypothetical protein L3Q65_00205 [Amycolatopsis sp. FU40]
MTDAERARILLRQCERLVEDLLARGWRIVPQVEETGVISALVHADGLRATVITLPASDWTSTVVGMRGGPAEGSLLRAPVVQWRYLVPMPSALRWARFFADDPSDGGWLRDWLARPQADPAS